MKVKNVLDKLGIKSDDEREVNGVSFDSRDIRKGELFFSYKGSKDNGNNYIFDAFKNGAIAVISDYIKDKDVYYYKDIDKAKDIVLKSIYDISDVKIIGFTGTNGKTSSAYLLYKALNYLEYKAMYIGTLGIIYDNYCKQIDNTTPNKDILYKEIYKAKLKGIRYVCLEVSSHGLSFDRVSGIDFSCVCFTNLSRDHLDYYINLEEYFLAKKKLFDMVSSDCIGFINDDDNYSSRIIKDFKGKVVRYKKSDYKIIKSDINGSLVNIDNKIIKTNLIYETNLYNIILVYKILNTITNNKDKIVKAIESVKCIKGRNEVIYNKDFGIIIDYAHTPKALENILLETNKIKKNKCIVLFGCGGNRDKDKRKIMGKIANKYADIVCVSSDNPRYENEKDIEQDIIKEIKDSDKLIVISDREKAIKEMISRLEKDDILLILGKGNERYQIIKDKKIELVDEDIVKKCLT